MKLEDDTFFDDRILKCIGGLLRGIRPPIISPYEHKLLNKTEELREIDNQLPDGESLIPFLQQASNFIVLREALDFMFEALESGMLEDAFEVIRMATYIESYLSLDDMYLILEKYKTESLPISFSANLLGFDDDGRTRRTKPEVESNEGSSFDLGSGPLS